MKPSTMPRVLLTTDSLHWPFARQTPGQSGVWEEFEFVIDEQDVECDAWVVFEGLTQPVRAICPVENTLFISAEPPELRSYGKFFLNQFRWVITCHEIQHRGLIASHQSQPWFVGVDCEAGCQARLDYDSLQKMQRPEKPHLISAAISNKAITPGHRQRLAFVKLLQERLGDQLHVMGRGHQEFSDKWDAVAPYRFHLALENTNRPNYITEKISDAYLGYAFPFYCGAPNVDDYYPTGSFEPIDTSQPHVAVEKICHAIESNLDLQRKALVEDARTVVFEEFNLFPRLARILREKVTGGARQPLQLYPKNQHLKLAWNGLRRNVLKAA